jgi:hypothetical protein
MIDTAKTSHYQKMITECKDTKQLFAVVNKLLGNAPRNGQPSDPVASLLLANSFNEFFVEKIERIRSLIPTWADPTPPHPEITCSLNKFTTVNEGFRSKIISVSPSKSCRLDPLPTHLLKLILLQVAPIITVIINKSLAD